MQSRSSGLLGATVLLAVTMLAGCGGGGGNNAPAPPAGNLAPHANAGADKNAVSASTVSLAGTATDDGTIASYAWSQTGGTPTVTLTNANTANASFTAPTVTSNTALTFRLTVTDNGGLSATDDIIVTITPAGAAGTVSMSGTITFDRVPHAAGGSLNYGAIVAAPARGVTVQAMTGTTVLTSAVTNAAGVYTLTVNASTNVFLRVRAEMIKTGAAPTWNFSVINNTAALTPVYFFDTTATTSGTAATQTRDVRLASGFDTSGAVTGARTAAPFAILDAVYNSYNLVLGAAPALAFPALTLAWSPSNTTAGGDTGTAAPCAADGTVGYTHYRVQFICVLGQVNVDTDEYDSDVINNAFAHYFFDQFSRTDYGYIDGYPGATTAGDLLDMRVAFVEGFANAFAGMAEGSAFTNSYGTNQGAGVAFDLESGTATNPGWFSAGSVQSILYDLYDSASDGADTVSLGFGPLYDVLVGSAGTYRSGVPQVSIFSFVTALKAANAASATGISAIVDAQGITGTTIDAYGSTETHNPDTAHPGDVLPVYTALVLDAAAVTVCNTEVYGLFNKLSVRRFLSFHLATGASLRFNATNTDTSASPPASDPDFRLYGAGGVLVDLGTSGVQGTETFPALAQPPLVLAAGDYVLELSEFNFEVGNSDPADRACFNVTAYTAP